MTWGLVTSHEATPYHCNSLKPGYSPVSGARNLAASPEHKPNNCIVSSLKEALASDNVPISRQVTS